MLRNAETIPGICVHINVRTFPGRTAAAAMLDSGSPAMAGTVKVSVQLNSVVAVDQIWSVFTQPWMDLSSRCERMREQPM